MSGNSATEQPRPVRTAQDPMAASSMAEPRVRRPGELLERMASLVRDRYMAYAKVLKDCDTFGDEPIPAWDGGEGRFGQRHKPIWPRIVLRTLSLGVDVLDYVEFTLSSQSAFLYVPAQILLTREQIKRYVQADDFRQGRIRLRWERFKTVWEADLGNGEADQPQALLRAIERASSETELAAYLSLRGRGLPTSDILQRRAALEYLMARRDYIAMGLQIPDQLDVEVMELRSEIKAMPEASAAVGGLWYDT